METVAIHKAKSTLSKLITRAAAGETIYIGGFGKPEAALSSLDALAKRRPVSQAFGRMKDIALPAGWDDPLPDEVLASFYTAPSPAELGAV
jgi:antitoxin (DNA-binding transcriptional repressor) of toxin-antitoxin stability system